MAKEVGSDRSDLERAAHMFIEDLFQPSSDEVSVVVGNEIRLNRRRFRLSGYEVDEVRASRRDQVSADSETDPAGHAGRLDKLKQLVETERRGHHTGSPAVSSSSALRTPTRN